MVKKKKSKKRVCTQVKKKLQKRVVADERVKAIKRVEKRTCERKYKRENVITTEEALLKPAFFFFPPQTKHRKEPFHTKSALVRPKQAC